MESGLSRHSTAGLPTDLCTERKRIYISQPTPLLPPPSLPPHPAPEPCWVWLSPAWPAQRLRNPFRTLLQTARNTTQTAFPTTKIPGPFPRQWACLPFKGKRDSADVINIKNPDLERLSWIIGVDPILSHGSLKVETRFHICSQNRTGEERSVRWNTAASGDGDRSHRPRNSGGL